MAKFKAGDEAFIVESNRIVQKVTVARYSGGVYLIKFEGGGGIQVKEHRLFATKEEAGIQGKKEEQKNIAVLMTRSINKQGWHLFCSLEGKRAEATGEM